jgi:hypothetical protein
VPTRTCGNAVNLIEKEDVMARLIQPKPPSLILPLLKTAKIKVKHFKSPKAFERELLRFLKSENVLHLSTCRGDKPRTTPVVYFVDGLTFYILSEGGGKFGNLKANKNVSFSIAAPYDLEKDFWGTKGVQAWGKAKVYNRRENPRRFESFVRKMKIRQSLKKAIGMKNLFQEINYKIIEIAPDRITYGSFKDGIFNVTWLKK